ncbi:hypothetical protein A2V56_02295 [Candidatus Woesebacteria bacterium RBG_19FT_COMBO_42_9]|uniref:Glycerophosphoryl diester phosphodiesterase membrane domain-containing protein n=1 Tax=Candidatus Woesebacteria bacterium RBG_16_42_24 TaxID=1802485 RepID=A0A1F7XL73_9BACT|nr:MAG: hypothetical protein A2V97_03115 [Candidatus Woesebacteria bacterium RBG_16_42_24]OGM16956.1 MAG: hypothetical protein A2V56_02295 [Candidatus Woesebacteria bacterium RBG_19FT_COMBO_42_9]OGM66418.1 MAG: hypothetical protein A2985_03125 [Candidatus Woesebacteria bacterium RIFCSPLOWO2_01_FULL_43_11]
MSKEKLPTPWEFVKHSFEIYFKRQNLFYLTKINLFGVLASLALLSPLFLLGFFGGEEPDLGGATIFILILFLVSIVASIVWGVWFQATIIKAVSLVLAGEIKGVKETFRLTWPRVGKYALTTFVVGLALAGGFLLLIIPGILVLVWYAFANYIIVEGKLGVRDALRRSKILVSGYFWQVLGRSMVFILFYILIQVVVSFIPIVGPLALTLFSPYYILLPYLMYEELKRIKTGDVSNAEVSASQGVGV